MKVKRGVWKLFGIFLFIGMMAVFMSGKVMQLHAETAPNYLTFTAQEAGSTISLTWYSGDDVQYSTDDGTNWTAYVKDTKLTLQNEGDTVLFKGKIVSTNSKYNSKPGFSMTGKIAASGSVTSLIDANGGNPDVDLPVQCLAGLFRDCKSLTSAPELPALRLSEDCYFSMFKGCTSLTSAPELPSTSLAKYCYNEMFSGCTALIMPPELPATTIAYGCYNKMFSGCTALVKAPELPARKMETYCYGNMFQDCISLKTIPELPATILTPDCYYLMFYGCKGLSVSPTKDAAHTLPWKLPDATGSNWATTMFAYCDNVDFGNGSDVPALNTTYYQACQHVFDKDDNCTICGVKKSETIEPSKPEHKSNYLTFTAQEAGSTISFTWGSGSDVQISIDNGVTWTDYMKNTTVTLTNIGDSVKFKGKNVMVQRSSTSISSAFNMTGRIAASGSITSLLDENGTNPNINIPEYCFSGMFFDCYSLTSAPELPALSVSDSGYYCMFDSCVRLEKAPELPATKIGNMAYAYMFSGCINLKTAQSILPATILGQSCYFYMFGSCISLTSAPKLPATTLAGGCYRGMFSSCVNLKTAPELPATTLAEQCYYRMFEDCESLSITNTKDSEHTLKWFIPDAVTDSCWNWNKDMFDNCDNVVLGNEGKLQPNTIYYQHCEHSYGDDGKCIYCGEENTNPEPSKPTMIEGNNGQYTTGNTGKLSFRSDAAFSEFVAVLVDGVKIDASNYELAEGSIIVRLNAEYLNTLSAGVHTIGIQSTNGIATAQFTITTASNPGGGAGNGNGAGSGNGTGSGNSTGGGSGTEDDDNVQSSADIKDEQQITQNTAKADSATSAQADANSPKTGDTSPVSCMVFIMIMICSFAIMIYELRRNQYK